MYIFRFIDILLKGIKPGHYRWRRGLKLAGYTKEYEATRKVEVIAEASSYNT